MESNLREVGRCIVLHLPNSGKVEGWLYGQVEQGYLISEDPAGSRIRLVEEKATTISYPNEPRAAFAASNLADVAKQIDGLSRRLEPPVKRALSRLDYRSLRRFVDRAPELRSRTYRRPEREYHGSEDDPMLELTEFVAASTDEVVELHAEVFDEFEHSGLAAIVAEHAEELAGLPTKYTLPSFDAALLNESPSKSEAEDGHEAIWSVHQHRSRIAAARRTREQVIIQAVSRSRDIAMDLDGESRPPRGTALRYFGASFQILMGTGLAVANTGLALTAGLTSTLVTIGATAVPTYIGVCTSVCAGLSQAGDGLGKIGIIQKDQG